MERKRLRFDAGLSLILRDKSRQTRGRLITTVFWDVSLEDAKNMVISHDMLLPVGALLKSFRVSA